MLLLHSTAYAQFSRLSEGVEFNAQLTGVASSGAYSPFWFANNRYGLGSSQCNYGYVRAGVQRDVNADARRNWRIGYGADVVGAVGMNSHFIIQQLYGDVQWKALRLGLGQKERPMELKNQQLSVGAMTTGINARPIPQLRLELPDFWTIPGTRQWLALKAHIAYGMLTDNRWQRQFATAGDVYSANSFYHSKAAFLRVGNTQRFPLTLIAGIEMAAQFGGESWNSNIRLDEGAGRAPYVKLPSGAKAFWHAFIPGGSDSYDGDYANSEGNQLGSWHLRLDYQGKGWSVGAYMEHYFEDHSQLFWQYGWRDMQLGVEVNLFKNPFLQQIVYEYVGTMDQSGPVYHDRTTNVPEQISGSDDYYNHTSYGAWQHSGFLMGNPLLMSPIYNSIARIHVFHNRIRAHHVGLMGQPHDRLSWRLLYTHVRSLGEYVSPLPDPQSANLLLVEATYGLKQLPGMSVTLSYGHNDGEILGRSNGAMFTLTYQH